MRAEELRVQMRTEVAIDWFKRGLGFTRHWV